MKAISILIAAFLVVSCSPVYVPNAINVPAFSEKNSFNACLTMGRDCGGFQTAYAITDHIGIMANASYAEYNKDHENTDHNNTDIITPNDHTFFEGGIGYSFKPLSHLLFETYVGYGQGKIRSSSSGYRFYAPSEKIVHSTMQRFFVQPSIYYKNEHYELGGALRVAGVNVKPWELHGKGSGYCWYVEPVFVSKLGVKHMKIVLQAGISIPTTTMKIESPYSTSSKFDEQLPLFKHAFFIYSIGWQVSLGGNKKNKNPESL